ncbi:MAG: DUF2304 domain-containing protein [Lentisphaerae bacterium]|nr:DUF2304 domain-containing protein [Lentisphaerota bacterium]
MSLTLQLLGIIVGIIMIGVILYLIRHKKLQEEFSTLWLMMAGGICLFAFLANPLYKLYALLKGDTGYGPGILLFAAFVVLFFLVLFLSVKLSHVSRNLVTLAQKLGILQETLQLHLANTKQGKEKD